MTKKKLLITGFTPFGPYHYNSSQEILSVLNGRIFDNWIVTTTEIPTSFDDSLPKLISAFTKHSPAAVLSFGMNAGSDIFLLETRARNILAVKETEPSGKYIYKKMTIRRDGPSFKRSTISMKKMALSLKRHAVPFRFSFNPGTYVCNYLYYSFLDYLAGIKREQFPYLFVHVPAFPGDALRSKNATTGMSYPRLINHCIRIIESFRVGSDLRI